MTESYQLEVQKNEQDELFVELPPELMTSLGWEVGDDVKWEETKEGGFRLTKVKYETVELDFDDEELFKYMQVAHERNQSFNQFVEEALTEVIEREKNDG
tara:strand:+ start:111001 stop:111300 length:300 start_codon:yes stop_codon:yes gene_type:complete